MLTAQQATMLPSWRCALAESLLRVPVANAARQEAVDLLYALLHRCRDSSDAISSPARKSASAPEPSACRIARLTVRFGRGTHGGGEGRAAGRLRRGVGRGGGAARALACRTFYRRGSMNTLQLLIQLHNTSLHFTSQPGEPVTEPLSSV